MAFSHTEKEVLIDTIPLAEITAVRDVNTSQDGRSLKRLSDPSSTSGKDSMVENSIQPHHSFLHDLAVHLSTPEYGNGNSVRFQNAFTVETTPDGRFHPSHPLSARAPYPLLTTTSPLRPQLGQDLPPAPGAVG